jgi:hypothetical protein
MMYDGRGKREEEVLINPVKSLVRGKMCDGYF